MTYPIILHYIQYDKNKNYKIFTGSINMSLLLFIVAVIIIYIVSFKESFTQEHIAKVAPVLGLCLFFIVVLCILGSLVK